MRHILAPLQLPYALALGARNLLYARGWLPQQELRWPVLSVGNLSVGGAGKTPVVIALATLLREHGLPVDVLSRGYGRDSTRLVERVQANGEAQRFGDEPLLIARAAGVPVYVGTSRWQAGLRAEKESSEPRVHLLDDGFQHRQLVRAIDLVVVHPSDVASRLLPVGRLREPLRTLRRADLLLLREDDARSEASLIRAGVRTPVWRLRRELTVPHITGQAFAFCAIAHPGEFFRGLEAHGVELAGTLAFRDHHRFTPRDLRTIAERARGASALLTTEKDLVRLSVDARQRLSSVAELHSVELRVRFPRSGELASTLLALLHWP